MNRARMNAVRTLRQELHACSLCAPINLFENPQQTIQELEIGKPVWVERGIVQPTSLQISHYEPDST